MIKNIIVGSRSNLSRALHNNLKNSKLISACDLEYLRKILDSNQEINIIYNSFLPSFSLSSEKNYEKYVQQSLVDLAKFLNIISITRGQIKLFLYTSSAAVYGERRICSENDPPMPNSLYGSLKNTAENLVQRACKDCAKKIVITRLFNMYGGEDRFSIISSIKNAIKSGEEINIYNQGASIRDYINIEDVVKKYLLVMNSEFNGLINIATGNGHSLENIIKQIKNHGKELNIISSYRNEINCSISSQIKFNANFGTYKHMDVIDYLID